jgi:SAM-dependent methyltransferase
MLSMRTAPRLVRSWTPPATEPPCRLCGGRLYRTLIDLGDLPLANRTLAPSGTDDPPYSLHVRMCDNCSLVQVADTAPPEALAAPRSHPPTRSAACLTRAAHHAETMRRRLRLGAESLVMEIGSRDGTLLHPFQAAGIPVLGIAPEPNAAIGIPAEIAFFNTETAMQIAVRHGCADLVIADNVLPYVPDLFDFAAGLASILRPNGIMILQVPHLLSLVQTLQFDAFRHDAYTYLSLRVLEHVLRSVGLRVFDAERLPDHGGLLRVHVCHAVGPHGARPGLKAVRHAERFAELDRRDFYSGFSGRVAVAQAEIRDFLQTRHAAGRRVAAYGAATRGITLLNCCGITTREIACVADPDPAMFGRLLPGSRIPIVPLETLLTQPPDDILILPWPVAAEIALELAPLRQLGTQLWTPLPRIARV